MYWTMRKRVYWPAMAIDVYRTVGLCELCMKELVQVYKCTNAVEIFPAIGINLLRR